MVAEPVRCKCLVVAEPIRCKCLVVADKCLVVAEPVRCKCFGSTCCQHAQDLLTASASCPLQVLPSKLAMFRGIDAWVQVRASGTPLHLLTCRFGVKCLAISR